MSFENSRWANLVGQTGEGEEEGLPGAEVGLPHAAVVLPVPLGPAGRTVGAEDLQQEGIPGHRPGRHIIKIRVIVWSKSSGSDVKS